MKKGTKVILMCWNDVKALTLTRHLNRAYPESTDLNGARLEINCDLSKENVMEAIRNCNLNKDRSRCPEIEYADVFFRRAEHSLVDLVLTESAAEDLVRIKKHH